MADRPTVRVRVNRAGAEILRSYLRQEVAAHLQLRRVLLNQGQDATTVEQLLDELRLLQREIGRAGEQMGWFTEAEDEG